MSQTHLAAIALGSNLPSGVGSPADNLQAAIARIGHLGRVESVSSFRTTDPVGYTDQPQFLNATALLRTKLAPLDLLHNLLQIEREMGRIREGVPAKGPRIIDLDLIFYDDVVLESAELTLPHPAMRERAFVLEPLAEVAPAWRDPLTGHTVQALLTALGATKIL